MKKILSLFMFVMCIAVSANAQSGTTENGLSWKVENRVLTITGSGAIKDNEAPWGTKFSTVIIGEGVTSLGKNAFEDCYNLKTIYYYGTDKLVSTKTKALSVFSGIDYKEILLYTLPGVESWYGLMGGNFYSKGNEVLWTLYDGTLCVKSNNAKNNGNFVMPAAFVDYLSEITSIELDGADQLTVVDGVLLAGNGTQLLLAADKEMVVIPATVKYIGDYALYGALSMTMLRALPAREPDFGDYILYTENDYLDENKVVLYLPNSDDANQYETLVNVYDFYRIELGEISNSGSWKETSLTWKCVDNTLTIEGVGEIPNGADFVQTWISLGVKDVIVMDGVTKIGSNVFANLKATSFTISKSVMAIDDNAFYGNGAAVYNFKSNLDLGNTNISKYATLNLQLTDKVDLAANVNTFDKVTLNRTFAANSGGTLILPFEAVVPNGMKVYEFKKFSNKVMQFEEVNTIAANTPYVWRSTKNVSSISSLEKTTLNHNDATTEYAGTTVDDWTLYGVLNSKTISAEKPGVTSDLWIYVGSTGQFKNYDAVKVAPYRAYLKGWAYNEVFSDAANNINASFPERSLSIEFIDMDGTTSIEEVIVDREGNISSAAEDGAYYDLSGRRVENPTTGIYIVNGKKVLVK